MAVSKHLPRLPLTTLDRREFRDAYERRAYLRAYLLGRRLLDDPALIEQGRTFLDRFVKQDPRQQRIYAMWTETLDLPVDQIVRELLADNPRGADLRETAPVFTVIPADEVRALAKNLASP